MSPSFSTPPPPSAPGPLAPHGWHRWVAVLIWTQDGPGWTHAEFEHSSCATSLEAPPSRESWSSRRWGRGRHGGWSLIGVSFRIRSCMGWAVSLEPKRPRNGRVIWLRKALVGGAVGQKGNGGKSQECAGSGPDFSHPSEWTRVTSTPPFLTAPG